MSLHLLRFRPDFARLIQWANAHHVLPSRADDDMGYALHAILTAAFGRAAPSPFAFLREPGRPPELLAYAGMAASEMCNLACAPEVDVALGLSGMASKEMPTRFAVGRRLGFRVRCRPVVRTDKPGDPRRARERDAFLATIEGTASGTGPTRDAVYHDWLAARLTAGGAKPAHIALDAYRRACVHRRAAEAARRPLCAVEGPDATFTGTLVVQDSERFGTLLARGVGRHRAFGFGMLLLRPC